MTDAAGRLTLIRERLTAALYPEQLEVVDESHKHVGHAGARGGGGHYQVTIVSPVFQGASLVQRHRMVYEALEDAMRSEIHALSIRALTPDESR